MSLIKLEPKNGIMPFTTKSLEFVDFHLKSSEKPINEIIETVFSDKSVLTVKRINVFLVVNVILLVVNFTQSVDTKG